MVPAGNELVSYVGMRSGDQSAPPVFSPVNEESKVLILLFCCFATYASDAFAYAAPPPGPSNCSAHWPAVLYVDAGRDDVNAEPTNAGNVTAGAIKLHSLITRF